MLRKIIFLLVASFGAAAMAADAVTPAAPPTAAKPLASAASTQKAPAPGAIDLTKPVPVAAPSAGTAAPATPSPTIGIVGSDLLQAAIGEPLSRYVKQNGVDAKVDFYGTIPALAKLKDGSAQLAVIAAPEGAPVAPPGYQAIELCFQVDYLLVNENNPLNAITTSQIIGVFGEGEQDLTRWEQLQLSGTWTNQPIIPCSTSTDDGIVVELFKYSTLGRLSLKATVRVMKTSDDLVKEIAGDPNAMGLSGYDPGASSKVLLVAAEKVASKTATPLAVSNSNDAVRPTEQTVYSGDYPLRLPFYLIFKPADKERLRELIQLLMSEEFAGHLREQHFMPVPETYRSRSLLDLYESK